MQPKPTIIIQNIHVSPLCWPSSLTPCPLHFFSFYTRLPTHPFSCASGSICTQLDDFQSYLFHFLTFMLIGMQMLRSHFKQLVSGAGVRMSDSILTSMVHHSKDSQSLGKISWNEKLTVVTEDNLNLPLSFLAE